ncbi:MAG: glycosyltransferase family 4 protein [Pelotomaculum sp.]|uniref:Glycosyltransferase n=1 Tax=Pelotomaculum thermopropionicum (strain DSM 13744 / JCM 10971 / SI) TaxID=370438 RepID=A5D5B7_PELTS|nr:glycosyltransferase family 4 protein [Pelotomaculum sp.]BAF58571.1 glycosyltransferase [Pelotomaculum thermopropionicum SI]
MRVVLAMPYSNSPLWGVQNVAYNLVQGFTRLYKELERNDIEITVLSNVGRTLKPQEVFSQCPQLRIVSYRQLPPITFLGDIHQTLLAKKYFHATLSSADIVHSHDVTFSLPIAKMFKDKPILHTCHGLFWNEKEYLNSLYQRFSYNTMTIRSKLLARLKNVKFVAISNYVAEEIKRELRILDDRVHISHNPLSEDFFNIEKREIPGLIFYPVRLIPRKNHLPLIEALGILKRKGPSHFTLALAGGVEDREYFNKIIQLVKKYGLENNVTFLGKLSKKEILEYYSRASIVILTSHEETFSLTVAEAMATGTPVVASPVGIVPEIVTDWKTGFNINSNDPEDIADKIAILLDDDNLRKKMGDNAKIVANDFKSENIAQSLISLWKKVIY